MSQVSAGSLPGRPVDLLADDALAIQTAGLTKRFGSQVAVDRIDLAVPRGAVFGFLGPNGSGKTTTIRVLLGLAGASAGSMALLGTAVPRGLAQVLPRVGALIEGPAFYPFLSGTANLSRLDSADPLAEPRTRGRRVAAALDQVGLSHAAGKKVHAYSLGMKQRLGIANALLAERELLVLDEPTNGLDPQGTREVRSLVRSFAEQGTTVFVSSHLLAEVQQICTHAAIMSTGRIVAQGTLDELRGAGQAFVRVRTPDGPAARGVLAGLGLVAAVAGSPPEPTAEGSLPPRPIAGGRVPGAGPAVLVAGTEPEVVAPISAGGPAPEAMVAALVGAGVRVRGFAVEGASLEDRFVALTGEGFEVAQ